MNQNKRIWHHNNLQNWRSYSGQYRKLLPSKRQFDSVTPDQQRNNMKTAYETTLAATGAAMVRTSTGALVIEHLDGTVVFVKQLPPTLGVVCGTVLKQNKY